MLHTLRNIYTALTVCLLFYSCTEDTGSEIGTQKFVSIFDNNQFNAQYRSIDIRQTPDGGYLVLANRLLNETLSGIYLLKADKTGNLVKYLEVEESFINAIPGLTEKEGKFYFFCMAAGSSEAHLAEVDESLETISFDPVGLSYPAASAYLTNDHSFLLLSYDPADKRSVLSTVSINGESPVVLASQSFSIGSGTNDKVNDDIMAHFLRTGREFPFAVGKTSDGLYFFNGFYEYTFSLVFVNMGNEEPIAVVQGQQEDGGFSAVMPLSSNTFAASRFNYGANFLLPRTTLTLNGPSTVVDLGGFSLPELVPNAPVRILRTTRNEKNVLIYGADTQSRQIVLLYYDEETGTLMGSTYLGFSNPFEIGNLITTADDGIAVCGTTYIAGRFARPCILKLPKDEVNKNVK